MSQALETPCLIQFWSWMISLFWWLDLWGNKNGLPVWKWKSWKNSLLLMFGKCDRFNLRVYFTVFPPVYSCWLQHLHISSLSKKSCHEYVYILGIFAFLRGTFLERHASTHSKMNKITMPKVAWIPFLKEETRVSRNLCDHNFWSRELLLQN